MDLNLQGMDLNIKAYLHKRSVEFELTDSQQ